MLNQTQLRNSLLIFNVFLILSYAFSLHIHPYRTYCNDALIILGLILMVAYWVGVPDLRLKIPHAVIMPFSLLVLIAIQTASNFIWYPIEMVFPVLYLVCFGAALICGATIAMQENGLATLCAALAVCFLGSGLLSVILQHIQLFDLELMPWVVPLNWEAPIRPFANFAQANTLALTLCFAVASVWYLYTQDKIKPVYALLLAVLLLWGLALTQSRIAWIILPLFFILFISESRNGNRIRLMALTLCMALFIGFVLFAPVFLQLAGGLADSVENRATQTGVRLVLWQQALAMSRSHPWLGVGWFQFGANQVMNATQFQATEYSDYAHNIVLNFAAETGWPYTLLLMGGCLYWIYHCCVRRWASPEVRYISFIFIAVAVHSMVEFPLWYAFFLLPFGLMVGALHTDRLGSELVRPARAGLLLLVAATLAAMAWIQIDYTRMSSGFDAIAKIQAGDKRYLPNIQKPKWTLFPQYYDYFHVVEVQPEPGMSSADLQFLEHISVRFGFGPILSRLAIACSNNNRPGEALQVLTIIQRIDAPEYAGYYSDWRGYAQNNPQRYGEIFRRMVKPDGLPPEKN